MAAAVAGPEADLGVFEGSELYIIKANETLTFEHTYTWWGKSHVWVGVNSYIPPLHLFIPRSLWRPLCVCVRALFNCPPSLLVPVALCVPLCSVYVPLRAR